MKDFEKIIMEVITDKLVESDIDNILSSDEKLGLQTKLLQRLCRQEKRSNMIVKNLKNRELSIEQMQKLISIIDEFNEKIDNLELI